VSDAAVSLAFALTAAVHLGFQLTVTLVVYPALTDAADPAAADGTWQRAHDRHSRRIARVVVLVYGSLLLAAAAAVASGPDRWTGVGTTLVLTLLAVTALGAAPLHVRLGRAGAGERAALLHALRLVDLARLGLAVLVALCAGLGLLAAV
jgi:hypothetical protein